VCSEHQRSIYFVERAEIAEIIVNESSEKLFDQSAEVALPKPF
jgi:hypothetical protein